MACSPAVVPSNQVAHGSAPHATIMAWNSATVGKASGLGWT